MQHSVGVGSKLQLQQVLQAAGGRHLCVETQRDGSRQVEASADWGARSLRGEKSSRSRGTRVASIHVVSFAGTSRLTETPSHTSSLVCINRGRGELMEIILSPNDEGTSRLPIGQR